MGNDDYIAHHYTARHESLVHCDTLITEIKGYYYQAAEAVPGQPVHFVREPENAYDGNAIAVYDETDRLLGYIPREIAAEHADWMDFGFVHLFGRLMAPGEPGYDPVRARINPPIYVWLYADQARLAGVLGQTG